MPILRGSSPCATSKALLVLAALALLLASCAQSGKAKPKIGVALYSFDDIVSAGIRRAIETEAVDKADLAIIDSQNQQPAQDIQVESFFARKLSILAINPVDGNALGPMIAKAKDQRTPIVFFGREPSDEAMRSWDKLFFVGTHESEAGAAQGEILAARWKADPTADRNKDGALQFIALDGDLDGPDSALLAESCSKALNAAGIKSARLAPEAKAAAAGYKTSRDRAAALIAKYGDKIEAVICGDNASTLGAIDAFKAAGYFKPRKNMPIVGLGRGELPPAIAEALSANTLAGTAFIDAESQGKAVFDLAYGLAKGAAPAKAGWNITDAKYIWIPYKEYSSGAFSAPRK